MEQNYTNQQNTHNNANRQESSYEYIAVLDLGSESMSAFLGKTDMSEIIQIDLQDLANIKKWTDLTKDDKSNQVKLLLENDESKSFRLRNKIVIKSNRGEYIKDDLSKTNHAELKFVANNNYKKSIFDIYQEKNKYDLEYLCNPKVIYAKGTKGILPKIMYNDKQINFEPAEYLKHLTTQIVNNVILKSPQISEKNITANNIKLVITIPNVYSLTHAKELIKFLKNHTNFAEVDYVYESDAVVYASLVRNYTNFSNNIKKKLENKFSNINKKVSKKEAVNIISHDIGKGTTDLSLFQIYPESDDIEKYNIYIRSRTGLTKAGNALDYIFVIFFEENILKPFYADNNIDKNKAISLIYNVGFKTNQNKINESIQKVIFLLKKNIYKGWFGSYCIPKKIYKQIKKFPNDAVPNSKTDASIIQHKLKTACKEIIEVAVSMGGLEINKYQKGKEKTKSNLIERIKSNLIEKIKSNLIEKINFNIFRNNKNTEKKESEEKIKNDLTKELYNSFINTIFKNNKRIDSQLKKDLNEYVEALGSNLPDILNHNADEITKATGEQEFNPDNDNTFVIISGQASQFLPLKEKLKEKYHSLFSIDKNRVIFLEDTVSKDICAIGGFLQQQAEDQLKLKNPNDLLADYYFMNLSGIDNNSRLDYKSLNGGNLITVNKTGKPQLFFCSIIKYKNERIENIVNIEPDEKNTKNLNIEDFMSFLKGFKVNGSYSIKYDKNNAVLTINNQPVELGDSPQSPENIYANTWPEILKNKK